MIQQGALENPEPRGDLRPARHFAPARRHRSATAPGPTMASSDRFRITVHGKQTHGAAPWLGVDPIVTAAQVVLGLQTVVSRGVDIAREPAVVTVGMIRGGVRENIIPDEVEMRGTIRAFDEGMRDDIHERVTTLAEAISRGLARRLHGVHQQELSRHGKRPRAHRSHGADAAARRGRGPLRARAQGHGRGGFLVLPAGGPRPVLLRGRHARGASTRRRPIPTTRRNSSPTSVGSWWACARWRTWPATSWSRT